MAYKANCTVYLCAGTGLDYNNSIWMHKFAYPYTSDPKDTSYWNAMFQFIKAHSIAEGYWYMSDIRPQSGVIRVGRNPQQSQLQWGESGLGSSGKQAELNDPNIPYSEAIRAVDYLVFTNRYGDDASGDTWYAFVDQIDYVNQNTALIHFTVDAILTFQQYFYFGRCLVRRDMQFKERLASEDGPINEDELNYQAEPIKPDNSMFVFQHCEGDIDALKALDLGEYSAKFVASDVALEADKITSNQWIAGLPAFKPAPNTVINTDFDVFDPGSIADARLTQVGLGVYFVNTNKSPDEIQAFVNLGAFNAFEHILYTYSVPKNIVKYDSLIGMSNATGLYHIVSSDVADNKDKYYNKQYTFHFPNWFSDDSTIDLNADGSYGQAPVGSYTPVNVKTYMAPYHYFSIADKCGNSLEVKPQSITSYGGASSLIHLDVVLALTAMPNMLSALYVPKIQQFEGSERNPMLTLWQVPSYVMTPNNSGYMLDSISASQNLALGIVTVPIGISTQLASGLVSAVAGAGSAIGGIVAGVPGAIAGGIAGKAVSNTAGVAGTIGSTLTSYGTNAILKAGQDWISARQEETYGLPKAMGGLPTGLTLYNIAHPGYEMYNVHLKSSLMQLVDSFFSRYGYAQNEYRYPHINIRRRWCFVQAENLEFMPLLANTYTRAGVPTEFRQQIIDRMKAGVTFWNVRRAIKGDDNDEAPVGEVSYTQLSNIINCKFIKNYGAEPDSDEIKDNISYAGGYCDYYTDDYQPNAGT